MRVDFFGSALAGLMLASCSGSTDRLQTTELSPNVETFEERAVEEQAGIADLKEVEALQPANDIASDPVGEDNSIIDFRDQDLTRLRTTAPEILSQVTVTETEEVLDKLVLPLTIIQNPVVAGNTLFFVMHDEENEAFEAMTWAVANFGGTAVAIENDDNRNIDGVDINGLFGREDRSDLNEYFLELINEAELVIALHNNWNHPSGTMHLNNTRYFTGTCDAGDDVDDVLITGEISSGDDEFCSRPNVRAFVSRGLNVAWSRYRDRRQSSFDCDRSCNFQKFVISYLGKPYYNLEAEHDQGALQQKQQLCAILDPLMTRPICAELE